MENLFFESFELIEERKFTIIETLKITKYLSLYNKLRNLNYEMNLFSNYSKNFISFSYVHEFLDKLYFEYINNEDLVSSLSIKSKMFEIIKQETKRMINLKSEFNKKGSEVSVLTKKYVDNLFSSYGMYKDYESKSSDMNSKIIILSEYKRSR